MGVSALYRDKGGEISRKHGDTLIGTLRTSYGSRFGKGCADNEKLSDALARLDEMLPIRLRTFMSGHRPW